MQETVARVPAGYGVFWGASTVSALGDGVRVAALPLLAAAVTRDPAAIAVVTAAGFLAWPVLGLVGGALSDRLDRRRSMWMVNAARALMLGVLSLVFMTFGSLPIAALAALAFALGAAETVYDNAAIGFLPRILPPDALATGNARLFTSQLTATQLIGPPLGGILFTVGAIIPLVLDGLTFAVSAALVAALRCAPVSATRPEGRTSTLRAEIADGVAWLWKDRILRTMAFITTALGAVSGALLALLVVYADRQLHTTGAGYGFLLSAFAVGSITGALFAPRLLHSLPLGRILGASVLAAVLTFAGLAVTTNALVAAVILAVLGVAVSTWNVTSVTTRQRIVPNHLLGRVSSAYRVSALSFTAIGALGAGILARATSIPITLGACAAVALLGLLFGGRGLRRIHHAG